MELAQIKADLNLLLAEFRNLGADTEDAWHIRCVLGTHADEHGSVSVFEDKGVARWKCHACDQGGTIVDLLAAVRKVDAGTVCRELTSGENPRTQANTPKKPAEAPYVYPSNDALKNAIVRDAAKKGREIAGKWLYTDAAGAPLLMTFRLNLTADPGDKIFTQARKVEGGWIRRNGGSVNPLYNLVAVSKSSRVVVCEGERCCDTLARFGFVATTSPMGAGKASLADWSPLADKKVALWPDNDDPGRRHANDVADILDRVALSAPLRMVDVDALNLPEGGDVVDLAQRLERDGMKHDEIRAVIQAALDSARQVVPPALAEFDAELQAVANGERKVVASPFPVLDRLTQMLLPRTLVIVGGAPESAKSFFNLQIVRHVLGRGERVAALMLEDGRAYHVRRGLAQMAQRAEVTNNDWLESHRDEYEELRKRHEPELRALLASIEEPKGPESFTVDNLLRWVDNACDRARVVVIDPISYMTRTRYGWLDDERFLIGAKQIVEHKRKTLVLVTHPTKLGMGKGPIDLSILAGGACYARMAQTILYLQKHDAEKTVSIERPMGVSPEQINRTVRLLKVRNAAGGPPLGFRFDRETLSWVELGKIVRDAKEE